MRALTMEEMEYVSGGYGEPNPDGGGGAPSPIPTPVGPPLVVTGTRQTFEPDGFFTKLWENILGKDVSANGLVGFTTSETIISTKSTPIFNNDGNPLLDQNGNAQTVTDVIIMQQTTDRYGHVAVSFPAP